MQDYKLYKGAWIFIRDPHLEIKLSKAEMIGLLKLGGIIFRNTYNFDCQEETEFYYVIKDSFGGMSDIPSKYRGCVRKALEKFEYKRVDKDYLKKYGYPVYVKAAEAYRVKSTLPTEQEFLDRINACEENFDLWACEDKETKELVAFAINKVLEESVDYSTMKFEPKVMAKHHSSYGLIYEMNRYYLEECGLKYVNDGARSITEHSNIQSFLIKKFHFRKAYCRLNIKYKWWFGIIVKLLFPFRKLIPILKVRAVLEMHGMQNRNI